MSVEEWIESEEEKGYDDVVTDSDSNTRSTSKSTYDDSSNGSYSGGSDSGFFLLCRSILQ